MDGGWWGSAAELPALAMTGNPISPSIILQTGLQNTVMISDMVVQRAELLEDDRRLPHQYQRCHGITISDGKGRNDHAPGRIITVNQGALLISKEDLCLDS